MLFPVAFLYLRQLQLMYIPTSQGTDFFLSVCHANIETKIYFQRSIYHPWFRKPAKVCQIPLKLSEISDPKIKKKEDDNSHAPLSLFLEGGRERTLGTSLKCMYCALPCSYFYRFGTDFYKISQYDKSICEEVIYFTRKHQKLQFCVP